MVMRLAHALVAIAAGVFAVDLVRAQTAKVFPPPARTNWKPTGCRTTGADIPALASRAAWRSLHADEVNTDEVATAYPPMFAPDWVAETATWNPTGPVFDDAGHLYFVPAFPYENVALISLDPTTGARRWSIPNTTAAPPGGGTPLVLDDPDHAGEQIIYVGLYDRIFAVRPDGSLLWDQPTGLTGTPAIVFGINYHPPTDALVGLSRDGFIYAVDRRTGVSILTAPFQLPGVISPPGPPLAATPPILACAQIEFERLAKVDGQPISDVVDVLLGNRTEVANFFSIDPATGRLWVGATAPDAEDGATDGVSSLGALYALDLVASGPAYGVNERCHASFAGGTASTPALPHDGSRVYLGDNVGNLLAIDGDCQTIWSVPVGGQITGSVAVSSDNREVYASTGAAIHQVIDHGPTASIQWSTALDVFDLLPGQIQRNANLAGIGANGIAFQAGAGYAIGNGLFVTTGMGLLDRLDGHVRWFAEGLDETVAVMSSGPDGALYIGNSPLRRVFMYCVAQLGIVPVPVAAPLGGIRKYSPSRYDRFFRDIVCAAADRASNARRQQRDCPTSTAADATQIGQGIAQAHQTLTRATAGAEFPPDVAARLGRRLTRADSRLRAGKLPGSGLRALCKQTERVLGGV
jgi:outer membrane protein assembly factor BamB